MIFKLSYFKNTAINSKIIVNEINLWLLDLFSIVESEPHFSCYIRKLLSLLSVEKII